MASDNEYEYENEESIDNNLKCPICNEPFIHAVTTLCHHPFCRQCLEKWFENNHSTCPTCRKTMSKYSLTPITLLPFLSMLDQILVKCKLCDQSNIQRGNFHDHINKTCPKTIVSCSASDINCPWTGFREEFQTHLSTCTFEQLRSQSEQNNDEDVEKVAKPINELTHNHQPIFQRRYYNDDMIFMHINPEPIERVPVPQIATAAREAIINNQCTHFSLFDCQLLPEYVLLIASAFSHKTILKNLELPKCYAYDLGAQYLAESLSANNTVEYLDLYGNFITDAGVAYIAEMLRLNLSLIRLKLAYNKIGGQGMKMLADVLISNNLCLKQLSLEGNTLIDDSCIYSIFNIIRFNRTLKILNLANCSLSWSSQKLIYSCQRIYFRTDLEILL